MTPDRKDFLTNLIAASLPRDLVTDIIDTVTEYDAAYSGESGVPMDAAIAEYEGCLTDVRSTIGDGVDGVDANDVIGCVIVASWGA